MSRRCSDLHCKAEQVLFHRTAFNRQSCSAGLSLTRWTHLCWCGLMALTNVPRRGGERPTDLPEPCFLSWKIRREYHCVSLCFLFDGELPFGCFSSWARQLVQWRSLSFFGCRRWYYHHHSLSLVAPCRLWCAASLVGKRTTEQVLFELLCTHCLACYHIPPSAHRIACRQHVVR